MAGGPLRHDAKKAGSRGKQSGRDPSTGSCAPARFRLLLTL